MKKIYSLFHDEKVQDTLIVTIVLALIITLSVVFL
jgi:hypothetical protein